MAEPPVAPTFCLTIPSGRWNLAPLVAAIQEHHPDSPVVAVWCGDPHLRPVLDPALGATWADLALDPPNRVDWNLWLCGLRPRAYEWLRTAAVVREAVMRKARVVVLRVGSVGVLGDVSALCGSQPITLIPRAAIAHHDGVSPSLEDLIREGRWCSVAAGFSAGSEAALDWLMRNVDAGADAVSLVLGEMFEMFPAGPCTDARVGVGAWSALPVEQPRLLDLEHLDREEPWHFLIGTRAARVRLSDSVLLRAAVEAALPQYDGTPTQVRLPGGTVVDDAVRRAVRRAITASAEGRSGLPPSPFGPDASEFLDWLGSLERGRSKVGRYWSSLVHVRPDLAAVFPRFETIDAGRYLQWLDTSWRLEERSVLIRSAAPAETRISSEGTQPSGVNVLGYLAFDQSLGTIARKIVDALEAAHVPVAALNYERSVESQAVHAVRDDHVARYATNLIVVNADQFEFVVADHGATLLDGRRTIAYWFWELEDVPARFLRAIDHVDEIWTGSTFIADAFKRVTDKPVRCVPLPVSEPQPSNRGRASMGLPESAYVFLTTFDQFSVPERKNPFGTIEAFTRAFAEGEGPVLLIKTMNGAKGWKNHERLLLAASGRSDIIVWDEHLSRPDQMAVLAAADCLVSLHRSEGLGLHCAEAMWLGKPVIATAYSGNLDFMDNTVAAMIDHTMVHVQHGEGIYPETAMWADPDLAQAADWMRRLVADPELGRQLGHRARERMQRQPSLADTGRMMAGLAGLHPSTNNVASTSGSPNDPSGGTSWD